jgi:hypothetical protein
VIGVKAWLYKGEILQNGKRTVPADGEPRRNERPRGDRDRDRRGPRPDNRGGGDFRGGDRNTADRGGDRPPAPPAIGEPAAPVQAAPLEGRRTGNPITPPLMAPTQPSWKDAPKQDAGGSESGSKPEGSKE